jgi:Cu(I)/Ag(I) efflux system membrane fusion protein
MNAKSSLLVALAVGAIAAGLYGAYWLGQQQGHAANSGAAAQDLQPSVSAAGERKVLYWHDPMVPGQRFDKPGKSPFMDMPLVPVYADDAKANGIAVSPTISQNLGLRTATVRRGAVETAVEAQGVVAQNERATVVVQSRAMGYIEKLYVRATLDPVRKEQRLATLYVPEWAGALSEYLALRKADIDTAIVAAARDRLRLLSIPDETVTRAERDGVAESRFTLTAPLSGVVAELGVREGAQVQPGMALFRIVDLGSVWVEANVPETQAGALRVGHQAQVTSDAYPDRTFTGKVSAILPQVDAATRTLRARIELPNPGTVLKPGMFVRVKARSLQPGQVLLVPQEAVIATGKRNVVIVARDGNRFEPVEVGLGRPVGSDVEVTHGLSDGQKVVTSSQFLIDSEASLKSVLARMEGATAAASPASASAYHAEGVVESVDQDALTIAHGPIAALQWPAMTMEFKAPAAGVPPTVKAGTRVGFEFVEGNDGYRLTHIAPSQGARP